MMHVACCGAAEVRIAAGGLVCVDWSSAGDMCGFAGGSTKACLTWIEERRARQEPFWVVECVWSEPLLNFIRARLGYLYDIDFVIISPDDLGYPINRVRMWLSALLRRSLRRLRPLQDLRQSFGQKVVASPDMYYVLNGEQLQDVIDKRAP